MTMVDETVKGPAGRDFALAGFAATLDVLVSSTAPGLHRTFVEGVRQRVVSVQTERDSERETERLQQTRKREREQRLDDLQEQLEEQKLLLNIEQVKPFCLPCERDRSWTRVSPAQAFAI